MNVLSFIPDFRIKACNATIEMSTREYINIAKDIIDKNEFQRKKVISSTVKRTLKDDLKKRCTIPPIVLGIKANKLSPDFNFEKFKDEKKLIQFVSDKDLVILDGLQRTYVLLELFEEDAGGDWLNHNLRCEVYIGVEKLGILYRMLTLNTGQTTMSTRHLLEILYFDYLDSKINDVELVLDKDGKQITDPINQYNFKEVIEGYNAFIEGKEIPIERADILQNIDTLNNLEKTDDEKEGFKAFLLFYNLLLKKLNSLYHDFNFTQENVKGTEFDITSNPFGKTVMEIFAKGQSLTGLGAALYFLKRNRNKGFKDVETLIDRITNAQPDSLYSLIKHFEYIRNKSKKVGNDQRFYFRIFYQSLFDTEQEFALDLKKSIDESYKRIQERLE